jgi:dihydrodipicolinate synthase/N-acetylneuraminate lyase
LYNTNRKFLKPYVGSDSLNHLLSAFVGGNASVGVVANFLKAPLLQLLFLFVQDVQLHVY